MEIKMDENTICTYYVLYRKKKKENAVYTIKTCLSECKFQTHYKCTDE